MSPENSFRRESFVVPQPLRLFRNQVGHFFGEKEICAFHSSYAARAWESAVEPLGPLHTEEHVFQSPDHARWPFPLVEGLAYGDERVCSHGNGVLVYLGFLEWRFNERAAIGFDGFVCKVFGICEGEAAHSLRRPGDLLIFQLGNDKLIHEGAFLGLLNELKKLRRRAVFIYVALGQEKSSDSTGILCEK